MGLTSYGEFLSDTSYITNPGAALRWTSSSSVGGLSIGGGSNDEILVGNAGDYLVISTLNWLHAGGGVAHQGRQWVQVNGTDVPLSAREVTINGSATNQLPITTQWLLTGLTAGASIKVWYANTDVTVVPARSGAITGAPIPGSWTYDSPDVPAASAVVLQLST